MTHSPIAIFVYKRPSHTLRLIESLKLNNSIGDSEIHVFCDGAKNSNDSDEVFQINKVREICRKIDFCKKLHLHFSVTNKGLAQSIIDGVGFVLEISDRIIVLEDDLVLSPSFINYMNLALEKYKNCENVFHISGYWFPVKNSNKLPKTFFYNTASCWGWATWARAWKHFNHNAEYLYEQVMLKDPSFNTFDLEGQAGFINQLVLNKNGKIKTWAIKWYATIFLNNALALHPNRSFVNNLGHDGSGDNCGTNSNYTWDELETSLEIENIPLIENSNARTMMVNFYKQINKENNSIFIRIKIFLKRFL